MHFVVQFDIYNLVPHVYNHPLLAGEVDPELLERAVAVRDLVLVLVRHLGVGQATTLDRLEARVPAKGGGTARGHNVALGATLEEDRLRTGTGRVGKRAKSGSLGVVEADKHLVQAVVANTGHKVLDVRTGEAIERVKAQRSVLGDTGSAELLRGVLDLGDGDLLGGALELGD